MVKEKAKDLRERLGDSTTERWYNNIILHIPFDRDTLFAPIEKNENIKVIITSKQHDGKEMDELRKYLNEHSLLIDCYTCAKSLIKEDICIGVNRDWSRPSKFLISLLVYSLKQYGYQIGINKPFKFAVAPECDITYNAIGLVINDRLFENEEMKFQLRENLNTTYKLLLNYWEKI